MYMVMYAFRVALSWTSSTVRTIAINKIVELCKHDV